MNYFVHFRRMIKENQLWFLLHLPKMKRKGDIAFEFLIYGSWIQKKNKRVVAIWNFYYWHLTQFQSKHLYIFVWPSTLRCLLIVFLRIVFCIFSSRIWKCNKNRGSLWYFKVAQYTLNRPPSKVLSPASISPESWK